MVTIPACAQSQTTPPAVGDETKASPPLSNGVVAPAVADPDAAAAASLSGTDCAGGEDLRKLSASANSPSIVYNAKFVPAWSTVDFGIPGVSDKGGYYFALLTDDSTVPRDDIRHRVRVRKAAPNDDLVIKQLLSPGDTIVSLDVTMDVAPWWWWSKRDLYIYQCTTGRHPINVSYAPAYISPFSVGWVASIAIVIGLYWLVARTFIYVTDKNLNGWHAVNPIRITAGPDDRGSLSAFQVFFFTMIVFSMLVVVLLRTGVLSDLSTTILELLGISGIGAAAAKGTDNSKSNLGPANLTWLYNKGWYDSPAVVTQTEPSFYDLISSDGSFDVYRFQSFVFTIAVGVALLIGGIAQLASFTIPQNILGILGLSQIVYIAGKVVNVSDAERLNAAVTDLRNAEAEFRKAALTPGAPTGDLQAAISRAPGAYAAYLEKATGAAKLFKQIIGRTPDQSNLAPSIGVTS
jgi:hypothetical protein